MKKIYTLIVSICSVLSMSATDFLVSGEYVAGKQTVYQQRIFTAGETHFQTLAEVLGKVKEGDNIYLAPGTYADNFTIGVNGLSIYVNNSWKDLRSK